MMLDIPTKSENTRRITSDTTSFLSSSIIVYFNSTDSELSSFSILLMRFTAFTDNMPKTGKQFTIKITHKLINNYLRDKKNNALNIWTMVRISIYFFVFMLLKNYQMHSRMLYIEEREFDRQRSKSRCLKSYFLLELAKRL